MKHMKQTISIFFLFGLTACGGGGGSDSSEPNFAGVWDASVSITKDECGVGDAGGSTLTDTFSINQSGSEITYTTDDGDIYRGAVDGDDSFTATASSVDGSTGCVGNGTTRFLNLDGNHADVRFSLVLTCPRSNPCTVEFNSGSGTRR